MHFQYVVAPPTIGFVAPPTVPAADPQQVLLQEIVEIQRQQLAYLRAAHEIQHTNARWQHFLKRWSEEFPGVGDDCLSAFPHVERAFLRLVEDLSQRLNDEDEGQIDEEFALSEFLDRYGARLSQLGSMLNILGPLADAARAMAAAAAAAAAAEAQSE